MDFQNDPSTLNPVRACPQCGAAFAVGASQCECGGKRPQKRVEITWSGVPESLLGLLERQAAEDALDSAMNSDNYVGFSKTHLKWSAPGTWIVVSALAGDVWLAGRDHTKVAERHDPTPAPIDIRDKIMDALKSAGLTVIP